MPVRRTTDGRWRYRHVVHYPDGTRERISGSAPTHINTKVAAEQAMLDHIERCLHPERVPSRKQSPTFEEWFKGRFWTEWVLARKNKPSEMREKNAIYQGRSAAAAVAHASSHLRDARRTVRPWRLQTWLGHMRIDETMLYVHVAESHAREWPDVVHEAARTEIDPDKRIVAMLGARGKAVTNTAALAEQNAAIVAA